MYNYDRVVTRTRIVALDLGPKKALINKQAHGLSFEAASKVFDDPLALSKLDSESSEERWQTVGMIEGVAVFVVHTWPGEDGDETKGRIISARRATSHERRAYEEGEFH